MRCDQATEKVVIITLSRRNVLALLHKVDDPGSSRQLHIHPETGPALYVHVEPDDTHYAERRPGTMSDATEEFIAARRV